jgi:hypothetical protein
MLKEYLKKVFAGSEQETAPAAQAISQEEDVMTKQEGQTNLAADINTAELVAQLAVATTSLSAAQATVTSMAAELEAVKAAMTSLASEKASLLADAQAAKFAARKDKVVATVGTAKADAIMAATAVLDDASFEAVVSALAASFEQEKKTVMFNEVGANVEVAPVEEKPMHFKQFNKGNK